MNPFAPGAHVVQALAEKLDQLLSSPATGSGNECNCVLQLLYNFRRSKNVLFHHYILCFSYLYPAFATLRLSSLSLYPTSPPSFSFSHSIPLSVLLSPPVILIYDIIRRLVASFSETTMELLLLLLKSQSWFNSCHMACYYHMTVMISVSGDPAMLLLLQTQAWR